MPLQDPSSRAVAYLVLRHLYDGDIIAWPIADDDPHRATFLALEQQGLIARWDRVWPLHDRYRLTESGIQAIEAVYKPAGAEAMFEDLRRRNLKPDARRAWLRQNHVDPDLWGVVHDPSAHWSTFGASGARYHSYLWEDAMPERHSRKRWLHRDDSRRMRDGDDADDTLSDDLIIQHPAVVDLDRQADDPAHVAPGVGDYDVS